MTKIEMFKMLSDLVTNDDGSVTGSHIARMELQAFITNLKTDCYTEKPTVKICDNASMLLDKLIEAEELELTILLTAQSTMSPYQKVMTNMKHLAGRIYQSEQNLKYLKGLRND